MPAAARVLLHVGVHRVEPCLDARIKLDVLPLRDEIGAVDADAFLLRLLVEQVHVGDQRVGALGLRDARALGPELFRLDAELAAGTRIPASASATACRRSHRRARWSFCLALALRSGARVPRAADAASEPAAPLAFALIAYPLDHGRLSPPLDL